MQSHPKHLDLPGLGLNFLLCTLTWDEHCWTCLLRVTLLIKDLDVKLDGIVDQTSNMDRGDQKATIWAMKLTEGAILT